MTTNTQAIGPIPPVRFTRRRYGSTTYTWAKGLMSDGLWHELGDPWPAITPKRTEIVAAFASHNPTTCQCLCKDEA